MWIKGKSFPDSNPSQLFIIKFITVRKENQIILLLELLHLSTALFFPLCLPRFHFLS